MDLAYSLPIWFNASTVAGGQGWNGCGPLALSMIQASRRSSDTLFGRAVDFPVGRAGLNPDGPADGPWAPFGPPRFG